jgi:hypothetical protein
LVKVQRRRYWIRRGSRGTNERRSVPLCLNYTIETDGYRCSQLSSEPTIGPLLDPPHSETQTPLKGSLPLVAENDAKKEEGKEEEEEEGGGPKEAEFDPDEDDSDLPLFPITHEIILKDHTKVVSALALDPSGARIVSGSHDYDCKLWDFGGMDSRCKPFKTWEPAGSYYVCFAYLFGPG